MEDEGAVPLPVQAGSWADPRFQGDGLQRAMEDLHAEYRMVHLNGLWKGIDVINLDILDAEAMNDFLNNFKEIVQLQ